MQKSYECDVATHIGPKSCGAARKDSVEALTGERAGRVLSRVRNLLRDADGRRRKRKAPSGAPISRGVPESRAVRDPVHVRVDTSRGNREIPSPPRIEVGLERIGKSKDARR